MRVLRTQGIVAFTLLVSLLPLGAASASPGGGGEVRLLGSVQSLPASGLIGDWTVAGTIVHVTASTRIDQQDAAVAIGARVEVRGTQQANSSIDASRVRTREGSSGPGRGGSTFIGTVQSLPASGLLGDWVVSGLTVHVVTTTRISQENGVVAVGSTVKVRGFPQADTSINATKIDVQ